MTAEFWLLSVWITTVRAEVLTPPYFNIAENRFVEASSTCGENVQEPELYCKLTGTNQDSIHPENLVIQGQVCDWCNMSNPLQRHPPKFAVDGSENFWMSPPLSRGQHYNEVNFTIDLGQEFHVSYVLIKMGNSPRPGVWVLERSADNGKTYKPWQYFADSDIDCELNFGKESLQPIISDDSVTCETTYSKIVPLQGGEIVVSLINQRPSANDFFNSPVLQEFTRATNVRLRFLRTKTLLGHLMSIEREDPSVTRRYFYSIKDISIGGRCRCNGHADVCDETHPTNPYKLLCRCKHNTTGDNCERCKENMVQKAWKQSKPNKLFVCEACNCHSHSEKCIYNETVDRMKLSLDIYGKYDGGGVCIDCQDNTEGINCEKCRPGYFRPYHKMQNEADACHRCPCDDVFYDGTCSEGSGHCSCNERFAPPNCDSCAYGYFGYPNCEPCLCFLNGTTEDYCKPQDGECPCKPNFAGTECRYCSPGYFDFPNCSPCECNRKGSLDSKCDADTGKCECNTNYGGDKCNECADGFFNFPTCGYCSCDIRGSTEQICSKESGDCYCKEGFGGSRCDQCLPGYFGFPNCQPCNCSDIGSSSKACDLSGKCHCLSNYGGKRCERCVPGFYNYPKCLQCNCDSHGSEGISCDDTGKCTCNNLFTGLKCDKCEEGRFNFPTCEECSCHPAGVVENFTGCGSLSTIGQLCQCKPRVKGRTCDECKPLYWNLAMSNPHGCQECDCDKRGIMGGVNECDTVNGQCVCKPFAKSRRCDTCIDGMYNLQINNLFGCSDCGCDVGGSESASCNKVTGQCRCRSRITGRTCSEPRKAHYFPTLYQFQYEAENGTTPDRRNIRYGSTETIFPGYSWKGYVVFSKIQSDLMHEVEVLTQTIYHMVLRYINPNQDNIKLDVKVTQPDSDQISQVFEVILKPTHGNRPEFVWLPAKGAPIPAALVLDPGQWNVHLHTERPLFLDYFVLLPAAYYEGNILVDRAVTPCTVDDKTLCKHFKYPSTSSMDHISTNDAFVTEHGSTQTISSFIPDQHLVKLGMEKISFLQKVGVLSDIQPEMTVELPIKEKGEYVLLINYLTQENNQRPLQIKIEAKSSVGPIQHGSATLPSCSYTWLCRQVVLDSEGKVAHFTVESSAINVTLQARNNAATGIEGITAVPLEDWSVDFITPKPLCVMKDGSCIETTFFTPLDFKKLEFESGIFGKPSAVRSRQASEKSEPAHFVYLDSTEPEVTVQGKVIQPGKYVFVVHYYQPDFPEYIMPVVIEKNNQSTKASLIVDHCPSNSGCRATLYNDDGTQFFDIYNDFSLRFMQPDVSSVWLDYLLIVPSIKYNDRLVVEEPIVKSGLFLKECGKNFFFLDKNASDLCKRAVFSITTAYNEGALACKCKPEASQSLQCEKFGGQCDCKPNIIGRRCEECKPGFFGYPYCKPCNCPALCDKITGACMCPPRVVGPNCDKCESYTFAYHSVSGCEPCNCNPFGVMDNDLQCDLDEGFCRCKRNVEGRKCDRCKAGYFSFPDCDQCECDLRGTTDEICDQESANCLCKNNVEGQACDVCRDGTFNIQAKNALGCTKCFCFGKTTQCSSSRLYRTLITGMKNWGVSAVNLTHNAIEVMHVDEDAELVQDSSEAIGIDLSIDPFRNKTIYLVAPSQYLGNRLTAYGGYLRYSLFCTTSETGPSVDDAPDIILYGASTYLIYFSIEVPSVAQYFNATIEISENNFILPNGLPVSREKMMQVLQDLQAIYIRATYWKKGVTTRLTGVSLDSAKETPSGLAQAAVSVEQCQCPPNYSGLSCEECAGGFYRAHAGPYGGFCIPCQCNGHAQDCDKITGKCINCLHNTEGDHCEKCARGYHGNATIGYPYDCLICACPLPMPSNNFADSCEMSEDNEQISCECKEGYTGYRCQACANGFYGNPEEIGDTCKRCDCSGNMNPEADISCDSVTGDCLSCLNNASGPACEICKPWYYGDAVNLKNCQGCDCNTCGSDICNHETGRCDCKPNVIGEKCDRCQINHYGFSTCKGCSACDCDIASISKQCEPYSGDCMCQPGVAGRTCNKCAPGHWNYTSQGCIRCECKKLYSENVDCDALTGQCKCLPGVLGATCDHCPELTVLDPVRGCLPCDTCVHTLVQDVQSLSINLDPFILDFSSVNSTYYLNQRLNYIDEEIMSLKGNVTRLEDMKLDLAPLENNIETIKGNITSLERKVKHENRRIQEAIDPQFVTDVGLLNTDVSSTVEYAFNAVRDVADIADSFETGSGKFGIKTDEFDEAFKEAKKILEDLENNVLEFNANDVKENYLRKAEKCLAEMEEVKEEMSREGENMSKLKGGLTSLTGRMENLQTNMDNVMEQVNKTNQLNLMNRDAKVSEKFKELKEKEDISNQTLNQAQQYISNTTLLLSNATAYAAKLRDLRENLKTLKENATDGLSKYNNIEELRLLVDLAREKAEQMTKDVDADIDEAGNYNTTAISAYKIIIQTIRDALMAANESVILAQSAVELSEGLEAKVANLSNRANVQYNEGRAILVIFDEVEKEFGKLIDQVDKLNDLNVQAKMNISDIESRLDKTDVNLPHLEIGIDESTNGVAVDIVKKVNEIAEELPKKLEESKELDKARNDAKDMYELANKQLEQATNVILNNELSNLGEELIKKSEKINDNSGKIKEDLENLRKQVESTREMINSLDLAVKFDRKSILELRKPDLMPLSDINYLKLHFKTEELNGLLLYLGNEREMRSRRGPPTNEFMALQIENGLVKLTIDLGSGSTSIINPRKVNDGRWYRAIVDRTGKNVNLKIIWEEKDVGKDAKLMEQSEEGVLAGKATILNLDKNKSKLFVGGFPSSFRAPEDTYNSFKGTIEDLTVGEHNIGLWNFVENTNAREPDHARDTLINTTTTTGFRFNGEGYAVIAKQDLRLRERSSVILQFKTFMEDGLIFLAAKENTYMSIELRRGQVLFQFDLGSGPAILATNKEKGYNTGTWHTVEAARAGIDGTLKVDGLKVGFASAKGTNSNLRVEHIYIGGYPNGDKIPTVSTRSFDGCIDHVQISGTVVDLNNNVKAFGVSPGCPEKIAKVVWFDKGTRGYAGMSVSLDEPEMELVLGFKTDIANGMLAYLSETSPETSIKLLDGQIVFTSGGQTVSTTAPQGYADSNWHVVMATHSSTNLTLFIDDYQLYISEDAPRLIRVLGGKLFLGGVPSEIDATAALQPHFAGCIGRVALNGQLLYLGNMTDISRDVIIGKCPTAGDSHKVDQPPILELPTNLPLIPEEEMTTQATITTTSTPPPKLKFDSPECKLPLYPESVNRKPKIVGYRFGTRVGSRLEYGLMKYNKHNFVMSFDVSTRGEEGLMVYASDVKFFDYFAVFLKEKKIHFTIKCGVEEKDLRSNEVPHDEWQTVTFVMNGNEVILIVNNHQVDEAQFSCDGLNISKPIYLGGINPDIYEKAKINSLKEVEMIFRGCIKNFKMGDNLIGEPTTRYGVIPCSVNYEPGVFFSPEGGYVKHIDKHSVGSKMTIEMEIKPRRTSGLLASIHGKDYMVLELVNGSVRIAIESAGHGEISSTFVPPDPHLFCDGNWHKIKAVKIKNIVTLAVDNKQSNNGIGDRRHLTTRTRNPLYLGGRPPQGVRGILSTGKFVGCMRSVKINDELQDIDVHNAVGSVIVGVCPTT